MFRNTVARYTSPVRQMGLRTASSLSANSSAPYFIKFQRSTTADEMQSSDVARWNDIFTANPSIQKVGQEIKRLVKQKGYCAQTEQPKEIVFDVFADGDVIELCQSLKEELVGKGITVNNREFQTILGRLMFEHKKPLF